MLELRRDGRKRRSLTLPRRRMRCFTRQDSANRDDSLCSMMVLLSQGGSLETSWRECRADLGSGSYFDAVTSCPYDHCYHHITDVYGGDRESAVVFSLDLYSYSKILVLSSPDGI